MADPADAKDFARPLCEAQAVPWSMYEKQVQQESGWQHWSSPGVVKTSSGNAKGLGQIVPSAHPSANWADPYENLRYSITLMASHFKRFGSWRKALASYNWGPGHVGGGFFGGQQHSPWNGTRDWQCTAGHGVSEQCKHYLDVILGPGWPEPTVDDGTGPAPPKPVIADPWTRTQLTNGSAVSTPSEWPTSNPRPIRSLVWHDMEGYLAGAIGEWNKGKASAHLCVLRDGTIVRTVEIENIAWHAGTNASTGRTAFWKANNINPYSIGIELEGFVTSGYTPEQINACVKIGTWALAKYGIQPVRGGDSLDGHHLHGEISNQRTDPGPLFPFDAVLASIKEGKPPVSVPDAPSFTYVLGFADLAGRLGAGVVGDPVEPEHDAERGGHPIRHQRTTRGEMVYWKNGGPAEFYRAA